MGKRFLFVFGVVLLCLQFGPLAQADVVWDNGGPASLNPGGSNMTDTLQAEDFMLGGVTSITGITFWNMQLLGGDYLGSISYSVVADNGGAPGAVTLACGTATPNRQQVGTFGDQGGDTYQIFQNDFAVNINLALGGQYWLVLHDGPITSSATSDFYWSWADPNATNGPTYAGSEFYLAGNQWTTNDAEHAFQLTNAVSTPEPATLILFGSGLLGLLAPARRKFRL